MQHGLTALEQDLDYDSTRSHGSLENIIRCNFKQAANLLPKIVLKRPWELLVLKLKILTQNGLGMS
jgi:hypothetical protein